MNPKFAFLLFLLIIGFLMPSIGIAGIAEDNVLDGMVGKFETAAANWSSALYDAARWLFFALALIEICWTGMTLFFRQADLGEVIAEITYRVIFIGFETAAANWSSALYDAVPVA